MNIKNLIDSLQKNVISMPDYISTTQNVLINELHLPYELCIIIQEYGILNLWLLPQSLIHDSFLVSELIYGNSVFEYFYTLPIYVPLNSMISSDYNEGYDAGESIFGSRFTFSNPILSEMFERLSTVYDNDSNNNRSNDNKSNGNKNNDNKSNDNNGNDNKNNDNNGNDNNDDNNRGANLSPLHIKTREKDKAIDLAIRIINLVLDYFREEQIFSSNCKSIAVVKYTKFEREETITRKIMSFDEVYKLYEENLNRSRGWYEVPYYENENKIYKGENKGENKAKFQAFNIAMLLPLEQSFGYSYVIDRLLLRIKNEHSENDINSKNDGNGNGVNSENDSNRNNDDYELIPILFFIN